MEKEIQCGGIMVCGPNGSGKTTLGRELAKVLNYKRMDVEDYYFKDSKIPYAKPRSREEVQELLLNDIKKYGRFVMSSVNGDWGERMNSMYELVVFISAPLELRLDRIRQRAYDKFGDRVLVGGDMYEQENAFFNYVATRSIAHVEEWVKSCTCPVLHVDGMKMIADNVEMILEVYKSI